MAFNTERDRLRRVMEAIANAMHFVHFGKRYYGCWWFYSPAMVSLEAVKAGKDHELDPLRSAFNRIPIVDTSTVHPEVFRFGLYNEGANELLFRFIFYGGFAVFARGVPFFKKFRIPKGGF